MKNRSMIFAAILLALACFALSPAAQAVSPPPDGGYAGGNTAEGQNALLSLSSGTYNTAVGYLSLESNTAGQFNTAIGAGALFANVGHPGNSEGVENTATGAGALLSNTTGAFNTANGAFALSRNNTGFNTTAIGSEALFSNTTGGGNTAVGAFALQSNIIGSSNTAVGANALSNTGGNANTAVGEEALSISTGSSNVAIGVTAGSNLTTGDNNIDIGFNVVGIAGESNTIRIGDTDITDTYIRGISGATSSGGAAVFVNGNGKLGTMTSSERFKDEIKPMDKASEAILALRPVTFRYKRNIDPQGIPQFGLVAEEVEKVNPDLVIHDAKGNPQTVRYEQINAMLLNEFLKAHRKIQEQEATIAQLRKEIGHLVAHSKEQDSKIQKVSDQIEIDKGKPGIVRNDLRKAESSGSSQ